MSNNSNVNRVNSGVNFGVDSHFNFNDFDIGDMDNFDPGNTNNFDFGNMESFDFANMDIDTLNFNDLGVDATLNPDQAFFFPPRPFHSDADMVLPMNPGPSTDHPSPTSKSTSSLLTAPTLPKSDAAHAHRLTKRKKVDEVDWSLMRLIFSPKVFNGAE